MRLISISIRLSIVCLLAGWILLLWLGIDIWQTGIQQQIDGSRGGNSFPYESFGRTCIRWASIWGFLAFTSLAYWGFGGRKSSNSQ